MQRATFHHADDFHAAITAAIKAGLTFEARVSATAFTIIYTGGY